MENCKNTRLECILEITEKLQINRKTTKTTTEKKIQIRKQEQ